MNKTQEKQLENIIVAYALVLATPENRIVRDLGDWSNGILRLYGKHHCGSAACFGGWVAQDPYFQAMGIKPDLIGAPTRGGEGTGRISENLFGDFWMFDPRQEEERDGTDKQIILRRLEKAADVLLSQ